MDKQRVEVMTMMWVGGYKAITATLLTRFGTERKITARVRGGVKLSTSLNSFLLRLILFQYKLWRNITGSSQIVAT